jgi:hypothetical protein
MELSEFCGKTEYSILQFIFFVTDEIRKKVEQKKLFYKEQIIRYVKKQIHFFLKPYNFEIAQLILLKNEMFNTIMFKLKYILKEYCVFQCL